MPNPEHLEILKQGVSVWNSWREMNPKITPDLSRVRLIGPNLMGPNRDDPDLKEADISPAELAHVDFSHNNLRQAKLVGAELNDANLRRADLRQADLFDAILHGADLTGANIKGARLIFALLSGADLTTVNLTDANLEGAVMGQTRLIDMSLSGVKGLELVDHERRSFVGIETLYLSEGKIPDTFLRGCGLSDWEIEAGKLYRADITPKQMIDILYKVVELRSDPLLQFYSCFISYSHADKSFAQKLHAQLQARGIRCWLDEHQLLPGDDIYDEVDRAIWLWDKTLLCCSKSSLTSWWVDKEISTAFEKEQELWKSRGQKTLALIPLNIDGYMLGQEWGGGKSSTIRSRLAADFTGWEKDNSRFEEQLEQVVKALRADERAREQAPKPRL